MRFVAAITGVLSLLVGVGCGSTASRSPVREPSAAESAVDLRTFAVPDATMTAYVRGDLLQALDLMRSVSPSKDAALDEMLSEAEILRTTCGVDLETDFESGLISFEGERALFAVRLDADGPALLDCVGGYADGRPDTVDGLPAMGLPDEELLVWVDGVLVGGDEDLVHRILATRQHVGQHAVSSAFDPAETWFYLEAATDAPLAAGAAFSAMGTPKKSEYLISVSTRSTEQADYLYGVFRDKHQAVVEQVTHALAPDSESEIARAAEVERGFGGRVGIRFDASSGLRDLRVPAAVMAELMGAAARRAAVLHAQHQLDVLATRMALVAQLEAKAQRRPARPVFLPSAPATAEWAETPPKGELHSTWRRLEFQADHEPFSYEIATDWNRRSTEVRATADLDEDGEATVIAIRMTVDRNGEIVRDRPGVHGDFEF